MKTIVTLVIALATIHATTMAQTVSSGTGFFVSIDGYFITNHHVIDGGVYFVAKHGGKNYPARIVGVDRENDVALLQVEGINLRFPSLYVDTVNVPTPGSDVFTIGFPDPDVLGETPKTTKGSVTALTGIRDNPARMQISVQIQPGNSGGPLVNYKGSVIGVTTATINSSDRMERGGYMPQNINYAVKAQYIKAIMDKFGVTRIGAVGAMRGQKPFEQLQRETEQAVLRVISSQVRILDAQNPSITPPPPSTAPNLINPKDLFRRPLAPSLNTTEPKLVDPKDLSPKSSDPTTLRPLPNSASQGR